MNNPTPNGMPFSPSAVFSAYISKGEQLFLSVQWYDWSHRPVKAKVANYTGDEATAYAARLQRYRPDLRLRLVGDCRSCR